MKITEYKTEKVPIKEIKNLPFNRDINMVQADKLLNSILNYGILRMPVLLKAKLNGHKVHYWTIDGQHMIAGLHKGNVEFVRGIVMETEDLPTIVGIMARLNNCNLRWTLDDYVSAYASLCNKEYEKLRSHKFATGLNYAISSLILGESNHNIIKDGSFKATSKDADEVTSNLVDVISFLGTNNSKFMKSFIRFRRSSSIDYNHKRFMQKLALNKTEIKLVHDETAMREILEKLYR